MKFFLFLILSFSINLSFAKSEKVRQSPKLLPAALHAFESGSAKEGYFRVAVFDQRFFAEDIAEKKRDYFLFIDLYQRFEKGNASTSSLLLTYTELKSQFPQLVLSKQTQITTESITFDDKKPKIVVAFKQSDGTTVRIECKTSQQGEKLTPLGCVGL